MPVSIRTFRNTDVQAICAVWNAHHQAQGTPYEITPLQLEWYSLAKPYFDDQTFWLAEIDDEVVGFLHYGPCANANQTDLSRTQVGLYALCVCHREDEDLIASTLLSRFMKSVPESVDEAYFRPLLPHGGFYLGLSPGDSMVGATPTEPRTCHWLAQSGFAKTMATCQWELDLGRFQAPIDRLQIQVRRAAHVNRQLDEPMLPWWQACVLGHAEPTSFQLTHRSERRVLGDVLYWSISNELYMAPETVMWLWPTDEDNLLDENHLLFLLAESLREFQSERVDCIRTVSLAEESGRTAILRRLGFSPVQNGVVFKHQFTS